MSASKVKIISGWSNPGGSTTAHINLTNLLNDNGYDCTFYGPHEYHLDKCKSGSFSDFFCVNDDTIISHFIGFEERVIPKLHIFSCHEKDIWPMNRMQEAGRQDFSDYDAIHFVSNLQKDWQAVDHANQVVIPPVTSAVRWEKPQEGAAGVIGSIDENKQVHVSIERALKSGYSRVFVFGQVTDVPYFNQHVAPYVMSGKAVMVGHESDREAMYGLVSEVFHSSRSETYGLVEAECRLSGIPFNGASNGQPILEKEEILEKWKTVLQLS